MRAATGPLDRTLRLLALIVLAAALQVAPARAQQQHQVASGERLDISVFRVPEMSREVVVDVDGQIAFPPLGQIPAAGRTAVDIAADIQQRLAGLQIMLDAQVTVGILAVRPVVIGGDVATPGAIPFERGLTVRRAIALAGGLGSLRPEIGAAAELRADRESIAAELLDRRAALARARAELSGADLDPADLAGAGGDVTAVLARARSLLAAARAESAAQKAFLARDMQLIEDRIARLGDQSARQQAVVDQQTAEVARYTDMQKRGLTPQTRVSEEYRTLNELRGNLSETAASIADAERQHESVRHDLDRFDARRAAELEAEVQATLTAIATLDARMKGATARLAQMGIGDGKNPTVTLYRAANGVGAGAANAQAQPVAATQDTPLQPGDLVEVDLPDRFSTPAIPEAGATPATPGAGAADDVAAPGRSQQAASGPPQRVSP